MDKVAVSKELFGELEKHKETGAWWRERVLKHYLKFQLCEVLSLDTVMNILLHGYEVEETPEDKVREYYYHQNGPAQNVIETTLDMLNIKIEGIN
jgi:hypothetical protein